MSKELQHTPGEWRWAKNMLGLNAGDDALPVLHYFEYEGMALCFDTYRDGNAALIAAAPELLSSLKAMVRLIEDNGLCVDECEDYDTAIAAIAKATGAAS